MRLITLLSLASAATAFLIPSNAIVSALEKVEAATEQPANALDAALENGSFGSRIVDYVRQRTETALDKLRDGTDKASTDDTELMGHGKTSNRTIYQLIAESKYTTKLAKLISDDDQLVKVLNGTKANYTVFAPTDQAFEKLKCHHGKDGKKPSKEFIREVLLLHVADGAYPAKRVLASHTIPTLHKEKALGGVQRLVARVSLKGLRVNFFSKVVAINIFAKNGVIHGIDTVLFFPPPALPIIELYPAGFSTLALALSKTGLDSALKKAPHVGSTIFTPTNDAFSKLGPKANAFLFSKYGRKYLAALLKYHVVLNQTVYSDAYYNSDSAKSSDYHHLDLPTLLEDRSLPVDIASWGPFIQYRVNGYVDVAFQDVVAKDGVVQVVGKVLIPPKKAAIAYGAPVEFDHWDGEGEIEEADLKARLEPYVDAADEADEDEEHADIEMELASGSGNDAAVFDDLMHQDAPLWNNDL